MNFTSERAAQRFTEMLPKLQDIAKEMDQWAMDNFHHEITITETKTTRDEDLALKRMSDTHRTGRAFDMRVKDLSEDFIAQFCAYFRKKYNSIGAVAKNQAQLIVYKPHGTGPHFHIQIKRNLQE